MLVISLTQIQLEYYKKLFTSSLRMFCGIFRERKGPRYRRFFCRTSFMKHFHFHTNLKYNRENLIFHLCPNDAIFLKNVFIFKDRTLKKNNIERTRISMWFGLEIDGVGLPPLMVTQYKLKIS